MSRQAPPFNPLAPAVCDTADKLRDHIVARHLENNDILTELVEFAVEEMVRKDWHHEGIDCVEWIVEHEDGAWHKDDECEPPLEPDERTDLDHWLEEHHYANHGIGAVRQCQSMPCKVLEGFI